MKFLLALTAAVTIGFWMTVVAAPGGVPAAVHYVPHGTVDAAMVEGGSLIEDPGLNVLAQHRGASGAEWHEHTNHIFLMVSGEATLVTGGTLVRPKQSGPGQMRAEAIEGGETYHLTKGDVMTIPAKTPHWWKDVPSKRVQLYTVNIEN